MESFLKTERAVEILPIGNKLSLTILCDTTLKYSENLRDFWAHYATYTVNILPSLFF